MLGVPVLGSLQYRVCVSADEAVLRDLKHLLLEAKQKVPEFLLQVESDWDFISRGGEDG